MIGLGSVALAAALAARHGHHHALDATQDSDRTCIGTDCSQGLKEEGQAMGESCTRHYPKPAGATAKEMMSQSGEDAYLDKEIFHGRRNGVYLDIGCNDGITGSNTYYFLNSKAWRGKCVEADPGVFVTMHEKSGRSDGVNVAVAGKDGVMPFTHYTVDDPSQRGGVDQVGGLADTEGAEGQAHKQKYDHTTINVTATTPAHLLAKYYGAPGMQTIDLVSLDVEGAELQVMRAWRFDTHCVNAFVIENNYFCNKHSIRPELMKILGPRGYERRKTISVNDFFVRKKPC